MKIKIIWTTLAIIVIGLTSLYFYINTDMRPIYPEIKIDTVATSTIPVEKEVVKVQATTTPKVVLPEKKEPKIVVIPSLSTEDKEQIINSITKTLTNHCASGTVVFDGNGKTIFVRSTLANFKKPLGAEWSDQYNILKTGSNDISSIVTLVSKYKLEYTIVAHDPCNPSTVWVNKEVSTASSTLEEFSAWINSSTDLIRSGYSGNSPRWYFSEI